MWLGFSFIKSYDVLEVVFKKVMSKFVLKNRTKLMERFKRMSTKSKN